jgi:hypothetical protein
MRPKIRLAHVGAHVHRLVQAQAVDRALAGDHAAGLAHPRDDGSATGRHQLGVRQGCRGLRCGCLCGRKASFCRGDVFLAKTFGCLRQGRLGRFDASGCLVSRRAGCIDRALAAGARCQQATLALEIALGLGGERLGLPEGLARLGDFLRPQAAAQLGQFRLRHLHLGLRCRKGVPIRLRVERGQARAGADGIALIESHLHHAPGLTEGQLHLADVDVAVEAQCILLSMVARQPERQCAAKSEHDNGDHDPTGFS